MVIKLDLEYLFSSNHCPPTIADRDHNFLYHRGTYEVKGSHLVLSTSFKQIGAIDEDDIVSFEWKFKIAEYGNKLIKSDGVEL